MLTHFALTIWRAAVDAHAYVSEFAQRRTGAAIGYLYALTTTIAFFTLLPFSIGLAVIAPASDSFATTQLNIIKNWYPDELVITISGGILTTNAEEPYILDMPTEWSDLGGATAPTHFVVIDTNATFDDFDSSDTRILLTSTYAVAREDQGRRMFRYAEVENDGLVIEKTVIVEAADSLALITPYLPWIGFGLALLLALVLPFIVGGALWASQLLFLFWATLILWIANVLMNRGLHYRQLLTLGAYGITNSLLLGFALSMLRFELWWSTWLLFFVWMVIVIARFPRMVPLPPPPPAASTSAPAPRKKPRAKKPTNPRSTQINGGEL